MAYSVRETENEEKREIKLASLGSGHHFLPLDLSLNGQVEMFLVDSGASVVTMNTKQFEKHFADYRGKEQKAKFKTADGSVEGYLVTVRPKCQNLAGQSVLKKFNLSTSNKGKMEFLTLTLR